MQIRSVDESDLSGVAFVAKKSYEDAFGQYFSDKESLEIETKERRSEKYFRSIFGKDQIFVAEVDDQIVGYIQFGVPSGDLKSASKLDIELRRLYVLSDFHGKGIGAKLIETMMFHDSLSKVNKVFVEVWKQNTVAVNLYLKNGFEFIDQQRPFYENGKIVGYDDVMVKKLH